MALVVVVPAPSPGRGGQHMCRGLSLASSRAERWSLAARAVQLHPSAQALA